LKRSMPESPSLPKADLKNTFLDIYQRLSSRFGPRHWWPGETPLEIMVGAVLTQNTAWKNVEKAIRALKGTGNLSLSALYQIPPDKLANLIRPAGYYNLKAGRLKNLIAFVYEESEGDLDRFFNGEVEFLRSRLLSVKGIGPETADSILLYAGGLPTFVVDAYTFRMLSRHRLIEEKSSYERVRRLFMEHLPSQPALYNEFHALIVELGKNYCHKRKPACESCPLNELATIKLL
jgi:endonuclease-3 related protein